jgi:hypothetical protein
MVVLVEYANRDDEVLQVDLMESRPETASRRPMHQSWGSIWRMDTWWLLHGLSLLRTTNDSNGKVPDLMGEN